MTIHKSLIRFEKNNNHLSTNNSDVHNINTRNKKGNTNRTKHYRVHYSYITTFNKLPKNIKEFKPNYII